MSLRLSTALCLMLLMSACSTDTPDTSVTTTQTEPPESEGEMHNPPEDMFTQVCENGEEMKGPWNNYLGITTLSSSESKAQGSSTKTLVEAGGVPTLIQNADGDLIAAFQWFPCDNEDAFDKVAISTSKDEGKTWSDPEPIEVDGLPDGYQRPFDPTLALLPDGQIRIYFTSNAKGMSTFGDDTNIYSAISDDGIHYTFEEGARFDLDGDPAYDSAVGYWDGLWHLITPNNGDEASTGSANHGVSEDGLEFEILDPIELDAEVNWTGNFLTKDDGLYFYGTPGGKGGKGNWFTFTEDGETWEEPSYLKNLGGDPAVTCFEDLSCLAIGVMMEQGLDEMK